VVCSRGHQNADGTRYCTTCGELLSAPSTLPPAQSPSTDFQAISPAFAAPVAQAKNGMGVAALVLGILGVIPLVFPIIMSILAIIFGGIGRSRATRGEATNKGVATAGLVLGIIGTLLNFLFLITSF